jgi:hypothetical protein
MSFSFKDALPWILGIGGLALTGGAFGIGPAAGLMAGAGGAAAGAGAAGAAGAGLSSAMVPAAAAPGIGAKIAGGIGSVRTNPAKFGMAYMGLAGLGSLADHISTSGQKKKNKSKDIKEQHLSRTQVDAPADYRPGFDPEHKYFSSPSYGTRRFAEGGPVQGMHGMGGGIGGGRMMQPMKQAWATQFEDHICNHSPLKTG